MDVEVPLPQGGTAVGVVRVGNTVRRPAGPRADYVRAVLRLLEHRGVAAPRLLGVDDQGRDILGYIGGTAAHGRTDWSDDQMAAIARLVRALHDATAADALAGGAEIVCHNDLAPWNLVVDGEAPVAFIDFDDAAPGRRIDDLAYLLWTFLSLGCDVAPEIQARRMTGVCAAYGLASTEGLLDAIDAQQARILARRVSGAQNAADEADRAFSASRAAIIQSEMTWMRRHRAALTAAISSPPGSAPPGAG